MEGTTEVLVQDWTNINRTPNEYYFIFDTQDKIPNEYFIDIKVNSSGDVNTYKKQLKFFKRHIKDYYEFPFQRDSREERIFLVFYFADFLGFYLSKLKKTKMGKTPLSDKIKKL